MADVQRTVEIIFQGQDRLTQSLVPVESSLKGLGEDADFAAEGLGGLGSEAEDLGNKPLAALNKFDTALKAIAVGLAAKRFLEVNVEAETFRKTMEFATGSTARASEEFEYIAEVSNRFGLELVGTAGAYAKFVAGTQGGVLSAEQLRTTFEGVAGTLSLVGSSSSDVEEALRQMTQGIGKNRFELEDLKSIAERVPGGMFAIAEALGVTTDELYRNISAGEFGAEQIRIYAETLNDGLQGVSFDTFQNSLNVLKNTISLAFVDLGEGGVLTGLSKGVQAVTTIILGASGAFELLGTRIGLVIGALSNGDWTLSGEEFQDSWSNALEEVTSNISEARDRFLDFGDSAGASAGTAKTQVDGLGDSVAELYNLDDIPVTALKEVGESAEEAAKSTDKLKIASQNAEVALEKIASNERIKNIEAIVSLNVAGIEADAQRAVAIIDTIGTAIQSTGELLGGLFDNRIDADSWTERRLIEEAIRKEEENRENVLKRQNKLIDAQIRKLRAQTDAIKNGEGVITVKADGLQPHLEAFMFEILESLQVRVNEEGYEMLLGV